MRGFGRVYKRGRIWWIGYSVNGKEFRESSRSTIKEDAKALLRARTEHARSIRGAPKRMTVSEAVQAYVDYAELHDFSSLPVIRSSAKKLTEEIGDVPTRDLTRATGEMLQRRLRERNLAAHTINNTLQLLITALRHSEDSIGPPPKMPRRLKTRKKEGYFTLAELTELTDSLPDWAADVFEFAFWTGWRRNEILYLPWAEVDFDEGIINLHGTRTKSGEPRQRPICENLEPIFQRRLQLRVVGLPYVFHRDGRRIPTHAWYRAWAEACEETGIRGKTLHDCRRTAATNLAHAGVEVSVAMGLIGHASRAIHEDYKQVRQEHLADGVRRLTEHMREKKGEKRGEIVPLKRLKKGEKNS